ncbi:MAG TPA: hypothetical protein EYQ06_07670 [Flavobacteriales bacterium]|jgi:hypothetical protein|nr:hypothetical protein [Flavobacteriales bacterium]
MQYPKNTRHPEVKNSIIKNKELSHEEIEIYRFTNILKGVMNKDNLIAHLTDNNQIVAPFTVDHILQLMNGVETENRSWVITNLANKNLMPVDFV